MKGFLNIFKGGNIKDALSDKSKLSEIAMRLLGEKFAINKVDLEDIIEMLKRKPDEGKR
jgi:hypothetical protein